MFDENRLKHTLAVAELMKRNAAALRLDAEEMFVLGFLHDVGHGLTDTNHEELAGEVLEQQSYKYAQEVANHGKTETAYHSPALDLLNWCDMHTDMDGKYISFERRLENIAKKYGESSVVYKNAKKLVETLQNKPNLFKLSVK